MYVLRLRNFLFFFASAICTSAVLGQENIYRCGGEYTNSISKTQVGKCKLISGNGVQIGQKKSSIKIYRGSNGHFETTGTVNGVPAIFLIDTGATFVAVSDKFARKAKISGGERIAVQTANGVLDVSLVRNVPIAVSSLFFSNVDVAVGLSGGPVNQVLLGQSALSKFEMNVAGNVMTLSWLKR